MAPLATALLAQHGQTKRAAAFSAAALRAAGLPAADLEHEEEARCRRMEAERARHAEEAMRRADAKAIEQEALAQRCKEAAEESRLAEMELRMKLSAVKASPGGVEAQQPAEGTQECTQS